eukprot:CAMPEP_0114492744 /NCGR_PEP_ID=MMETSP0109-20121206/3725_1 /TAXON_ID=29199 /ORGANISM="Chlorarachnion reptans, Strain CCCM449" /LENGTH=1672 /DNA_ID=CAMNT_0001669621 /DNA_START=493 /DNA_END=5511 /DNA_ORIENTATION=-
MGATKIKDRLALERKKFLSGMGLLVRGSFEEKLCLTFSIYDEQNIGALDKVDILRIIKILQASSLREVLNKYGSRVKLANDILNTVGQNGSAVNLEAFKRLNSHNQLPALSRWLVDIGGVGYCGSLSKSERDLGRGMKGLGKSGRSVDASLWCKTRGSLSQGGWGELFSEREMSALETQYYSIQAASNSGKVSRHGIAGKIFPTLPSHVRNSLVAGIMEKNGEVSLDNFVQGVSLSTRQEKKGQFAYILLAAKSLSEIEGIQQSPSAGVLRFFSYVYYAHNFNMAKKSANIEDPSLEAASGNVERKAKDFGTEIPQERRDAIAAAWSNKIHFDIKENKLPGDKRGILMEVLEPEATWFFQCFVYFAAVELGIRPQLGECVQEGAIIRKLALEASDSVHHGSTVFVLSLKWANRWAKAAGIDPISIHALKEKEKQGNSSIRKCGGIDGEVEEVGRIDNSNILEPGSISALRPKLVVGRDYIAVVAGVWTALSSWYGGGPMLPRIVVRNESRHSTSETSVDGCAVPLDVSALSLERVNSDGSVRSSRSEWEEKGGSLEVELYPWKIVARTVDRSQNCVVTISRSSSLQSLKSRICEKLKIPTHRCRLWSFHRPRGAQLPMPVMLESEITLIHAGMRSNQEVVVEQQEKANRWEGVPEFAERTEKLEKQKQKEILQQQTKSRNPGRGSRSNISNARNGVRDGKSSMMQSSTPKSQNINRANLSLKRTNKRIFSLARTGLYNLGNTCFLNAALQCLAATPQLTRYFLAGLHLRELNRSNPLGTSGHLALQYAALIHQLQRSRGPCGGPVAPVRIRAVMAKKYRQFASHQQQDAQEFLSLLMDGLHEDLNRVLEKPYQAMTDSCGRADSVVASEHIEGFLLRNRSVIIDLFCGVTKSKLEWEIPVQMPKLEKIKGNEDDAGKGRKGSTDEIGHRSNSAEIDFSNREDYTDQDNTDTAKGKSDQGGETEPRKSQTAQINNSSQTETKPIPSEKQLEEKKVHSSIKFEPFTMLSLPMPTRTHLTVDVTLIYDNPSKRPLRLSLRVPIRSSFQFIRNAIADTPGSNVLANRLFLCEVHEGNIYPPHTEWVRYTGGGIGSDGQSMNSTTVSIAGEHDSLVAYEVPVFDSDSGEDSEEGNMSPRVDAGRKNIDKGESSPRADSKNRDKKVLEISLNARFDVMDRYGKWFCATVVHWDPETGVVRVAFDGYTSQHDEDIDIRSGRIAPLNTRASSMRSSRDALDLPEDVVQVICMHRRLVRQAGTKRAFPRGHVKANIFGLPIMLFVKKSISPRELYYEVWKKTWRYAPTPEAHRPLRTGRKMSKDIVVRPFRLRLVGPKGYTCSQCPWDAYCIGLPLSETAQEPLNLSENSNVAIDWTSEFTRGYLNDREMGACGIHRTRLEALKNFRKHVDIGRCFELFTECEKIKEVYCSQVKRHLPALKTMELYSLPPILIVHLKRLVQGGKIQTFVDFPHYGFDPSLYLTSSSKHSGRVCVQQRAREIESKIHRINKQLTKRQQLQKESDLRNPNGLNSSVGGPSTIPPRPPVSDRKREESKRITVSSEGHLYDLYAVINHYGGAGGGHYVALAKAGAIHRGADSPPSTWYRFDDSAVTRISERDVITRNAYVVFYVRRDMDPLRWDFLPKETRELLRHPLSSLERKIAHEAAASAARGMSNDACLLS